MYYMPLHAGQDANEKLKLVQFNQIAQTRTRSHATYDSVTSFRSFFRLAFVAARIYRVFYNFQNKIYNLVGHNLVCAVDVTDTL